MSRSRNPGWILATALVLLSCDGAFAAEDDPIPNPYHSGVFARTAPSDEDLAAYAKSLETYARRPRRAAGVGELLTDKEGRSNELILLADDDNAALRALVPALAESKPGEIHAEDAIVLGIENGDKSVIANFANPIDARYVVDNDRADEATRELFKYDDPYRAPAALRRAALCLDRRGLEGVRYAEQAIGQRRGRPEFRRPVFGAAKLRAGRCLLCVRLPQPELQLSRPYYTHQ
ncbi:MAG: hypothetical protein QM741_16420 [Rudaea sp.]|uniref:hypothetical protein n=1 Tax=Rudaea sp. TaxID=2136325 RepID=UPI0039E274A7